MAKAAYRPDEYDDEYEEYPEEYDEYDDADEQQDGGSGGLFSTPARAITILGSVLMLLVLFAGIGWLLASRNSTSTADVSNLPIAPRIGSVAPDFELVDVKSGTPLRLSSLRGKPVWVNFWGTWCPPCRAEMPEMQKIYDRMKDKVEIIGVSMGPRDYPEQVVTFVDQYKYNWKFVHDPDMTIMNRYIVQGIPSSFFIDKDGVIRSIHVGGADGPTLESNLTKVFQ